MAAKPKVATKVATKEPSRTKRLRAAFAELSGSKPKVASAAVLKACEASGIAEGGTTYAADMGRTSFPVLFGGKGSQSWDRAYYSLTVNTFRRFGKGDAASIALAHVLNGTPIVIVGGHAFLVATSADRKEAREGRTSKAIYGSK